MTDRGHTALLFLVVALGSALRFFRLDFQSLWNDELSSWLRSGYATLMEVIELGTVPDVHPPGYYVLLHFVQNVFGDSEWALRAPSAIFGALGLIAVYALARRLYGVREGLLAAAMTATLWAPISVSQEARPYALLILLATLTMRASYEVMVSIRDDRRLSRAWFATVVALSAACSYTHYFGLLLVALQAMACAALAGAHRKRWMTVIGVYGTVGVLCAPWVPYFLIQLRRGSSWIPPLEAAHLLELPSFYFNRSNLTVWVVVLIIAAAVTKTLVTRGKSPDSGAGYSGFADLSTAWWLAAPIVAGVLVSWLVAPVVTHKNLLICLPPCVILVARCVWILSPPRWLPPALGVALVAGSLTQLIVVDHYYTTPTNTQYREAAHHMVARSTTAGVLPIAACTWSGRYLDYYFEDLESDLRVEWLGCEQPLLAALLAPEEPGSPDRLWFVAVHRAEGPGVLKWLREHYFLLESKQFIEAYVLLLERRPDVDKGFETED
jgi:mannosyltransferase